MATHVRQLTNCEPLRRTISRGAALNTLPINVLTDIIGEYIPNRNLHGCLSLYAFRDLMRGVGSSRTVEDRLGIRFDTDPMWLNLAKQSCVSLAESSRSTYRSQKYWTHITEACNNEFDGQQIATIYNLWESGSGSNKPQNEAKQLLRRYLTWLACMLEVSTVDSPVPPVPPVIAATDAPIMPMPMPMPVALVPLAPRTKINIKLHTRSQSTYERGHDREVISMKSHLFDHVNTVSTTAIASCADSGEKLWINTILLPYLVNRYHIRRISYTDTHHLQTTAALATACPVVGRTIIERSKGEHNNIRQALKDGNYRANLARCSEFKNYIRDTLSGEQDCSDSNVMLYPDVWGSNCVVELELLRECGFRGIVLICTSPPLGQPNELENNYYLGMYSRGSMSLMNWHEFINDISQRMPKSIAMCRDDDISDKVVIPMLRYKSMRLIAIQFK